VRDKTKGSFGTGETTSRSVFRTRRGRGVETPSRKNLRAAKRQGVMNKDRGEKDCSLSFWVKKNNIASAGLVPLKKKNYVCIGNTSPKLGNVLH